MVKVKNENVGKGENYEEQRSRKGGRTGKGKGKKVANEIRLLERFISVKVDANFEEWARKMRKIALGHRVNLSDTKGMEIIPNIFENIGWGPLLTVNELYYLEMIYEFYANLHKGRVQKQVNITYQRVTSRVGGRDISFDDRIFYTKNKKCFDSNLYSERRFEELFTKGEVLKRHDERNINKLDAYGRLLHHMISNVIIPNVSHKPSIVNMHSFDMLALYEHKRMNFRFMAIEHMLATQPPLQSVCHMVVFSLRFSNTLY
ncbi:hypothetical protein M9H77_06682 [Catharanthus roseus]|uniref:Uncharacterized protein n=1 Tax=Catharanthus roseus TaxID=4058 RepID=A0ACC0BT23_CATRO|nr:hypothetical protein M9H77_06682 [Catharanthus roseus]